MKSFEDNIEDLTQELNHIDKSYFTVGANWARDFTLKEINNEHNAQLIVLYDMIKERDEKLAIAVEQLLVVQRKTAHILGKYAGPLNRSTTETLEKINKTKETK